MGILRDFENRLEGAVEGFFARAFRSGLQPVELAKAIQRYAANYKQVGLGGVYVPNVYRFRLSAEDMDRFSGFSGSLQRELAGVVRRTVEERDWRLQGPVRIELEVADDVRVGTYELRGKLEASTAGADADARSDGAPRANAAQPQATSAPGGAEEPAQTMVLPAAGSPRAALRVEEGPETGREITVRGTTVIGRLPDCDAVLADPSVSRRHAKISRLDDRWTVEDLGSTNGLRVNGKTVGRAALRDGDQLELGSVRLSFAQEA